MHDSFPSVGNFQLGRNSMNVRSTRLASPARACRHARLICFILSVVVHWCVMAQVTIKDTIHLKSTTSAGTAGLIRVQGTSTNGPRRLVFTLNFNHWYQDHYHDDELACEELVIDGACGLQRSDHACAAAGGSARVVIALDSLPSGTYWYYGNRTGSVQDESIVITDGDGNVLSSCIVWYSGCLRPEDHVTGVSLSDQTGFTFGANIPGPICYGQGKTFFIDATYEDCLATYWHRETDLVTMGILSGSEWGSFHDGNGVNVGTSVTTTAPNIGWFHFVADGQRAA